MTDESQHGILKQNFLSLLSQHVGHLLDGSFKELKGKPMQEELFYFVCGCAIVEGLSWAFGLGDSTPRLYSDRKTAFPKFPYSLLNKT